MKNRNNNNGKLIAGLLAVIALCMVSIVALMLANHFQTPKETQAGTEVEEQVNVEGKQGANEETDTVSNSNGNAAENVDTENPYYQYEGELSEEPITPTAIENVEILDYFRKEKIIARYKEEIMEYAIEYSKKYPVYGNPTIIPGCEPFYATDTIIVDIHAADNHLISFNLAEDNENAEMFTIASYIDEDHYPVVYNGLYILNSSILYDCLTQNVGLSSEEANEKEMEFLKRIWERLEERGYTEELFEKTPYIYLNDWSSVVDDNGERISNRFNFCSSLDRMHPFIEIGNNVDLDNGEYSIFTGYIMELQK